MMPAKRSSAFTYVRFATVSVVAVVTIAACGVDDRVVHVGNGLDDAVSHLSLAICDRRRQCFPTYIRRVFGTYDECVTRTKLLNAWIVSLQGSAYTSDALQACADAWNRASCDQATQTATLPECRVPGKKATGEPCNSAAECETYFCKQEGYACGTCAPEPPTGTTCSSYSDCGDAEWCMSDQTCQPPAGANQPCSASIACDGLQNCVNGVCVPRVDEGGHCDNTSLLCNFAGKGLTCDAASTCVADAPLDLGASCGKPIVGYCEKEGICRSGRCAPGPSDDGACDGTGAVCEPPAVCVNRTCQLPTAVPRCGG
jgi:hypothetical protein